MAKFFEKLSTRVKHQAPDFVLDEHPRFLEFVKQYYTFMESAEISVTSVLSTDWIQLESETDLEPSVLLLDANRISSNNTTEGNGDKVLQESSSYGKFEKGDTITVDLVKIDKESKKIFFKIFIKAFDSLEFSVHKHNKHNY